MNDDDLALLLFVGWLLMRRSSDNGVVWGDGWMWPVARVRMPPGGVPYEPTITQEFHDGHNGVDVMFARRFPGDQPQFKAGTHDGTPRYFAPPRTPVLAARSGVVWSCEKTPRGWAIVLDHSKPFATFYQHLEMPAFVPHHGGKSLVDGSVTHVTAGQVLGFMGFDPTDPEQLRHLHFEVWYGGAGDHAIDPADNMRTWPQSPMAYTP